MAIIGSCSICGGNVTVPDAWYGVHPPVPKCDSCGAVKKTRPVIEMEPVKRPVPTSPYQPHIVPLPYIVPSQPAPGWEPIPPVTCVTLEYRVNRTNFQDELEK